MSATPIHNMTEARIQKQLDNIIDKVEKISDNMSNLTRLEEGFKSQVDIIDRISRIVDNQGDRLREAELSLAKKPEFSHMEEKIIPLWEKLQDVEKRLDSQEQMREKSNGVTSTVFQFMKWVGGILAAIIVVFVTAKETKAYQHWYKDPEYSEEIRDDSNS